MFLEPGEPRRVLAKKLQYLLLLALRIAVLVLLALAFAQPALWRKPQAAAAGGARLHLIVLDGSASMGDDGRWERARAAARDVIDSLARRRPRPGRRRGPPVRGARRRNGRRVGAAPGAEHGRARRVPARLRPAHALDRRAAARRRAAGRDRPRHRRPAEQPADALRRARAAARGRGRDPRRVGRQGRQLDDRKLRRLRAHGRARGLGAQLRGRGGAQDRAPHAERQDDRREARRHSGGRPRAGARSRRSSSRRDRIASPCRSSPATTSRPTTSAISCSSGRSRAACCSFRPISAGRGALFLSSALGTLATLGLVPETRVPSKLTERPLAEQSFVVVTDAGLLGAGEIAALTDYVQNGGRVLLALAGRSAGLTTRADRGRDACVRASSSGRPRPCRSARSTPRIPRCAGSTTCAPRSSRVTSESSPAPMTAC